MPADYYGFDTVELTLNHDDRPGGHHYYWVKEKGGDPDKIGGLSHAVERFEPWDQVWKSNCPLEYYSTTFITERSITFMDDAIDQDKPFFLTASYPDPHHPFGVPEPYYSMYDRDAVPIPETFHNDHVGGLPHLARMAAERGKNVRGPFSFSISLEQYREAVAAEYFHYPAGCRDRPIDRSSNRARVADNYDHRLLCRSCRFGWGSWPDAQVCGPLSSA